MVQNEDNTLASVYGNLFHGHQPKLDFHSAWANVYALFKACRKLHRVLRDDEHTARQRG